MTPRLPPLQEARTSLTPRQVVEAAVDFFARRSSLYAAFVEQQSDTYVSLRGQGGEEIAIAAAPVEGATRVTGSSYLFTGQVARFLAGLPAASHAATS